MLGIHVRAAAWAPKGELATTCFRLQDLKSFLIGTGDKRFQLVKKITKKITNLMI